MASNGTAKVQAGRLKSANISHYFKAIFVSQEMGVNKPDKLYFDRCADRIPGYDPRKSMIVGDSLTSDMRGGELAGLQTCWFNPHGKENSIGVRIDCEITALSQLLPLLKSKNP